MEKKKRELPSIGKYDMIQKIKARKARAFLIVRCTIRGTLPTEREEY